MTDAGSLWERVRAATRRAQESGALQRIATQCETIPDDGIPFRVYRVTRSAPITAPEQAAAPVNSPASVKPPGPVNPFLPYDPRLFVAELGPHHVGLLNKFPVTDHHLLIVTRAFVPQDQPLDAEDWRALASCLGEFPSVAYFNSGQLAGASQTHRHLQLIPLSDDLTADVLPTASRLAEVRSEVPLPNAARLPFQHWAVRLPPRIHASPARLTEHLQGLYDGILREVATHCGVGLDAVPPYNLLVTRDWLLLVPRRDECFHGISLNAMAFAGTMLVRDEQQLERIRTLGPLAALRYVAYPRTDAPSPLAPG